MALQLVKLPDVERVSSLVIRILAGNPGKACMDQFTLQGTNTYLIGRGNQRLLIDTGEGRPAWSQTLESILTEEKATITSALITHWHHDHVNGIQDLKKLCPEVRVYKHDPDEGQFPIEEKDIFHVEGATLEAIYSPGHTQDHMSFWLKEENSLFTGDNVLGQGTSAFEELGPYLSSLETLRAKGSVRGYPGHGPVIENPGSKITEYLKHRQEREDEILRLLRSRNSRENAILWSPKDLAQEIYPKIPEEVMLPAINGIVQVLMKLENEGRVSYHSERGLYSASKTKHAL